jgi:hypothetical protein
MDAQRAQDQYRDFSRDVSERLRAGMILAVHGDGVALDAALREMCLEARRDGHPPEQMVITLKGIWRGLARPAVAGSASWDGLYRDALTRALTFYFETPA